MQSSPSESSPPDSNKDIPHSFTQKLLSPYTTSHISCANPTMSQPTYTSPNGTVYIAGGQDATCKLGLCPVSDSVYGYRPSIGESSAIIVLYVIVLALQVYLGWRHKTWTFMGAMITGCLDEILGYVGRIMLWHNPWNHPGFIMQIGMSQASVPLLQ